MTLTQIDHHVLRTIRRFHKPWSLRGGMRLDELAMACALEPMHVDAVLIKLQQNKLVIGVESDIRPGLLRYYLAREVA